VEPCGAVASCQELQKKRTDLSLLSLEEVEAGAGADVISCTIVVIVGWSPCWAF